MGLFCMIYEEKADTSKEAYLSVANADTLKEYFINVRKEQVKDSSINCLLNKDEIIKLYNFYKEDLINKFNNYMSYYLHYDKEEQFILANNVEILDYLKEMIISGKNYLFSFNW